MKVQLSDWHESATCCWCEKESECVTVTFSDGFLTNAAMCWKCLQTAFRVRSRQATKKKSVPQETA